MGWGLVWGLVLLVTPADGIQAQRPEASAGPTQQEIDAASWFREVCEQVQTRFYDESFGGHDWPRIRAAAEARLDAVESLDDLSVVINDMLAELQTSHTAFYTNQDLEYYYLLDIFSKSPVGEQILKRFPQGKVVYTGIGIFSAQHEGNWFLSGVVEGGPAHVAGLRRGMKIVSVDGEPYRPVESFRGKAGQPTVVRVQSTPEDASQQDVIVEPVDIEPQAFLLEGMRASMSLNRVGDRQVGYVRIWSYAGEPFHELLQESVTTGALAQADALVIDLRDGWGGASPEYLNLFNRQVPQLKMRNRTQQGIYFDSQWRKPVSLLVNSGTRSGKEVLAYGFRKFGIGPVIGTRTAGAVVGGSPFLIGDRAVLYLATMGIEVDGEVLEGQGVAPDQVVEFPLPFGTGEDVQRAAAMDAVLRDP